MSEKNTRSVFKEATKVLAALPGAVKLPNDLPLHDQAKQEGCFHPVLVSTEFVGSEDNASSLSTMMSTLARLAYENMQQRSPYYDDTPLKFVACHWTDKQTGKLNVGVLVGTSNPQADGAPTIPVRQMQESLKNVQHHLIGSEKEGILAAHWEMVPTNLDNGELIGSYAWRAQTPEEIELVKFMAEYARLQGMYYKLDAPKHGMSASLFMKKEDLERIHDQECVKERGGPQ